MSSSSSSDQTQTVATYPIIPKSDLIVKEQLGVGTYGSVHKGIWKNGEKEVIVALKKVFMLEKEVDILSQVRHRNIIQFYGVSHANPDFYIVTEFAENGSLYEYLHNDGTEVTFDSIIKWALQIAQGVHYLHYEAPATIIHRDLKSKNVVLGKNYVCKLCDFGTSKDLTHSYTEPTWGGTAAWMSPEIINQKEGITTATDIWSFGVCLWELVSREVPYKGLTEFKIYSIISQYGSRLTIPETCPTALSNLLRDCWHVSPRERLDMKQILGALEQMDQDYDLRRECETFVEKKDDWQHEIQQQLQELEEMKMDLARQKEELERREKALRQRESSHRNFLQMLELMKYNNVVEWNEECVCAWIQHFLMGAIAEMTTESVDKLMTCVLQYEINGSRLLKVTERDLETLDIQPLSVRQAICAKIDELRITNVDYINFPSLQMSALFDVRSKLEKQNATFGCNIVLHVGTYHRRMGERSSAYRFKVFLDTDWEQNDSTDSVPPAIHDSATVIKEVFITVTAANGFVLMDTTRCVCPPFGYLEWVDVDLEDLRESGSLPLTVTVAINYTDQVVQPRSTSLNLRLDGFEGVSTLCQKEVPLRVRIMPTETSLSRISSALFSGDKSPSTANLQGVWRRRASSFGTKSSVPPEPRLEMLHTASRPPAWSEVAAGNTRTKSPPRHSKSTPNGDTSAVFTPPPLPPSTSRRMQLESNGRARSAAINIPQRRPRKASENDAIGNKTPEAQAGFYLSSNSPSDSPVQLTPQEQRMNPLAAVNGASPKNSSRAKNLPTVDGSGFCIGYKRQPSHQKEQLPKRDLHDRYYRRRYRKFPNKKLTSSSDPLPTTGPSADASSQVNEPTGKSTQKVYGGYNKWRWKDATSLF